MNPPLNQRPVPVRRESDVIVAAAVELVVLLFVPITAFIRLAPTVDGRVLAGGPLLISAVSYLLYRMDKLRAGTGTSRVPEWVLHASELCGGWPGAFMAQRVYRHKTAKLRFQVVFWLIILVHHLLALNFLLGWRLLGAAHVLLP